MPFSIATPRDIKALKSALAELGFNVFFDDDGLGAITPWLRHALREFMIYAAIPQVARVKDGAEGETRWLDRLEPTENKRRYEGPIDGRFTSDVDACLQHWHDNHYRCPVVASLFVNNGSPTWPEWKEPLDGYYGNYWRYDDPRILKFVGQGSSDARAAKYDKLQVRICDLSNFFGEQHGTRPADLRKAGRLKLHNGWVGGVVSDTRIVKPKGEVLPETLIGQTWAKLDNHAQSTFRVVRAVSELECFGLLAGLNGYDDAFMSLGPCHWTLSLGFGSIPPTDPAKKGGPGELPAFLAYWASENPQDAEAKLLKPFAVTPDPAWVKGQAGRSAEASWKTSRNYVGSLRWNQEDPPGSGQVRQVPIERLDDVGWFRTTHWFWRFLALARNVESFRRRQWNMARLRLRDILNYHIDLRDRPGQAPASKTVTLGQIFKSEVSVALLLRCHIRKSAFLDHTKFAHPSLRLALAFADIKETDPAKWTQAEEELLIQSLLASASLDKVPKDLKDKLLKAKVEDLPKFREELAKRPARDGLLVDCQRVAGWPARSQFKWGSKRGGFELEQAAATPSLRRTRGSFTLDDSDLPPMPS